MRWLLLIRLGFGPSTYYLRHRFPRDGGPVRPRYPQAKASLLPHLAEGRGPADGRASVQKAFVNRLSLFKISKSLLFLGDRGVRLVGIYPQFLSRIIKPRGIKNALPV